ncbi:MAG: MerR family transcriptional regulator [Peptostreptococcus sp.]|uniref:MerR family transcriptional regulator n=1 Tax=Peptostreptococcus sp. TaxID=1262 RepID=UPI002FCBBCCF
MEYTVSQLAKISGVSGRTLRYYDEIDLLKPKRIDSNGYRIYTESEIDMLQQILFYRELDFSLEDIKKIVRSPEFEIKYALKNQLINLQEKRNRLDKLIKNVNKTILSMEGDITMSDIEKFEGFKKKIIEKNEKKYGKEIRSLYGDLDIDRSNSKIMQMSENDWSRQEKLSKEINEKLKLAMQSGDPSSDMAQEVCELHKKWLCMFWSENKYSKEAHKSMGQMYVIDERFRNYYDKVSKGAAQFLKDSLDIYCEK